MSEDKDFEHHLIRKDLETAFIQIEERIKGILIQFDAEFEVLNYNLKDYSGQTQKLRDEIFDLKKEIKEVKESVEFIGFFKKYRVFAILIIIGIIEVIKNINITEWIKKSF